MPELMIDGVGDVAEERLLLGGHLIKRWPEANFKPAVFGQGELKLEPDGVAVVADGNLQGQAIPAAFGVKAKPWRPSFDRSRNGVRSEVNIVRSVAGALEGPAQPPNKRTDR